MYEATMSHSRTRRTRPAAVSVVVALGLAAVSGQGGAEPLLFDTIPDPRTAGDLPPALAASADPLHLSLQTPGGDAWLRGEVPSGVTDPDQALRGINIAAGVRLPLVRTVGFDWEMKPTLTGSAPAAVHREESAISPGIGVALGQALSLSLPFGLRLGAEGSVGDRLGVGNIAGVPSSPALAMRAGATLSTDLMLPVIGVPLQIGLGLSTAGPIPGSGTTAGHWYDAADCTVSLAIATMGGVPLRVSSHCPGATTGAVSPISFGFKTDF